jgi:predicted RNA-binding Zn-ribbon protein involved in translation (DUF1610 family)
METRYDSFCGIYCGACDILIANEEGNVDPLAQKWKMKIQDLLCLGCKTDVVSIYCSDCKIKKCAVEKKIEFCFQCSDYPCEILRSFRNDSSAHHSSVIQNLEDIRKEGIEKWLGEQYIRWRCPDCGVRFAWYDKSCPECHSHLYNCEEEEKGLIV